MYFEFQNPKDVCRKINRVIFSCIKLEHITCCNRLLKNFEDIFGNYNDDEYSLKQLRFNLNRIAENIQLKYRLENRIKKVAFLKTEERVKFFRDPNTHYVFACFVDYKTTYPKSFKLCFYKDRYCELTIDYINSCEHPIFSEYRDLFFKLKSTKNLVVLTPHLNMN